MTQTAAGEDPLVLRAFRTLSPASQQSLCPEIAEVPGHTRLRQAECPERDTSFTPSARGQLCEAYLRTYAVQAPSRTCRHLTAAMDDTLQGGFSESSNVLAQHTTACRSCSEARTNLAILRNGSQAALTGLLLDAAQNAAIRRADTPDASSQAPAPAAFDMSTRAGPGSPPLVPRPRSRSVTRSRAALLVAALSVTVAATGIVTAIETTSPSDTPYAPDSRQHRAPHTRGRRCHHGVPCPIHHDPRSCFPHSVEHAGRPGAGRQRHPHPHPHPHTEQRSHRLPARQQSDRAVRGRAEPCRRGRTAP